MTFHTGKANSAQITIPSVQKDMILMYKIMNGQVRLDKSELFMLAKIMNTRGHAQKVFKQHATKAPRINAFSVRAVNNWNALPSYVVGAPTINSFKHRLDKHWKNFHYVTRN